MSTPAPATATTAGPWRRHRATALVVVGVLAALAVAALTAREPATTAAHDPANPGADGARATAEVLRDHGVDVTVVRDAAALEDTGVGAGTTVVVTSTELLGRSTTSRLLTHAADADLVVVEPGRGTTEAMGLDTTPVVTHPSGTLAAECPDRVLGGLRLAADRALAYPGPGCFADVDGVLVAEPRDGLTLLGAGDALTNEQVLRADNAALVLRLLGQRESLVWYVPDLTDLVGDDGVSLETLLPAWLRPGFLLVVLGAVALVGWRVRRLGPLAVEPLPVTVRSLETTRSRGRLYRRAADRDHAAAALRRATRRRLARRLAVPAYDEDALLAHLATRLDRPVAELAPLVGSNATGPATDTDLTTLAADLAALEEEVGRP